MTARELTAYYDTPEHLRHPTGYIMTGYRPQLSYAGCFRSLFYMHNQWAIVWTFVLKIPLSALACGLICARLSDTRDMLPFFVLLAACLVHAPVSAMYHLFMPVSPSVKLAWNRADYALIFVMTVMISYALGYYPFYCEPRLQLGQMVGCAVPAAFNIAWALTPLYRRAHQTRLLRVASAAVVIALALLPVFYAAAVTAYSGRPAAWGLAACAMYPGGALVWIVHFPEKWFPCVFDNHMNSHAWMHVCIVAAHLLFYGFVFESYRVVRANSFACE